ncbi:hypothetical protein EHP00_1592 [Ecytonucleospora hepatopenaei]|uniref:Uncharacterized protein n=1 Tax=Ecytonucleospora hepatopenaei TaxID=646526 RepID=A0A1W0E7I3_9MICR|nr:hypothetical protein EHP00_1592 [Ecytonucleospora hepatopenaei]
MQKPPRSSKCVQMPFFLDVNDLPDEIKIDEVFSVNNLKYILTKVKRNVSVLGDSEKEEVIVLKQVL